MKNSLISVIVPVFNVEKYLKRCIESIVNQTYRNLEIILIDDGSIDNSPKICDEYSNMDNRIKVYHKKNEGVSIARNFGIDKSTGEYITFVDSDDYIEPTFIEELFYCISKYDVDCVTSGYNRVYDTHIEKINSDNIETIISGDEYLKKILNVQNGYGFVFMKLIKKETINNVRFNEKIVVGEDALFNVLLCKNIKKVMLYHKPLYNYYFNSNSVVRKYDCNYVEKYLKAMECMNKYIRSNYTNNKEVEQDLYNYISYHVLLICVNYCYHPENKNSGINLLKKICNIPLFKEAICKSNYKNLSLTRKISLFTIKKKMYGVVSIICRIRQKQFQ